MIYPNHLPHIMLSLTLVTFRNGLGSLLIFIINYLIKCVGLFPHSDLAYSYN
ncbi:hypothetical protein Hanom_Chr05g00404191 [Helianthus anomalus]